MARIIQANDIGGYNDIGDEANKSNEESAQQQNMRPTPSEKRR